MNEVLIKILPSISILLALAINMSGYLILKDHRVTTAISMIIMLIGITLTVVYMRQDDSKRAPYIVIIIITSLILATWLVRYLISY